MPFDRPSLASLKSRVNAQIAAALEIGAVLPKGSLAAFGAAMAGLSHLLHGHLDWLSAQFIPTENTSTEELERIGRFWKITRKAAVGATGLVTFTGSGTSTVPQGTIVTRADQTEYATDAAVNLVAGTANIAVTATVADGIAGAATNADVGTALTLQAAVTGINGQATVADQGGGIGLSGGSDIESDLRLLERILLRVQTPPHGSAEADFVGWALETAGVTRAWVRSPWGQIGTIGVGFVRDDDAGSIIPDGAAVTAMQAYLSDATRKPVGTTIVAFAPTAQNLNANITLTPNTAATRAAVDEALESLLLRETELGGTLKLTLIRQAISNAPGVDDFTMSSPAANVTSTAAQILVLGTTTYS